jgi:hypothetical protein
MTDVGYLRNHLSLAFEDFFCSTFEIGEKPWRKLF